MHQIFANFQGAYGSIDLSLLVETMLDFDIPPKLVRMMKLAMRNVEFQLKIQGELTQSLSVNVALDYVIRKMDSATENNSQRLQFLNVFRDCAKFLIVDQNIHY